ncbi:UDP-glucuronosyl/UDP-glucosyltransferase [Macrophomina phaseolina MS6]|uniref:UDP-glucuronosyl/UDP-glucosyltransferase n=1 Tax=Macrophomina phaseolina (strain MS6) TaxID=1126212 RepID=K2R5K1_MACPH|nr:UDP-glucuronosyl/UDP-glucosyltransferase [Macrophomina phaseolina MS6]
MIEKAGFVIVPCQPRVEGRSVAEDLRWKLPELVGSERIGRDFIEGQLAAMRELRPDVVMHGMWPFASLAARMLGLPTIAFLPLPLHPTCLASGLVRDLPDSISVLTRLPRPLRQRLARAGSRLMTKAPIFHQQRLGAAASACGWANKGALSLFEAVQAKLTVVTDLPAFYTRCRLPDTFRLTGPVFASNSDAAYGGNTAELDPGIVAAMRRGGRPAILLTMGSSSTSELLFEAIRALARPQGSDGDCNLEDWNVVVLVSPSVCRLDEARTVAGDDLRFLVTDQFVPGPAVSTLADAVVTHGGQGTVQTAIAAGTPIVGVGLHMEQQTNLDHIMDAGAGIRIQLRRWRAPIIRRAVHNVLTNPAYRSRAAALAETMRTLDGPRTAAVRMWEFLLKL